MSNYNWRSVSASDLESDEVPWSLEEHITKEIARAVAQATKDLEHVIAEKNDLLDQKEREIRVLKDLRTGSAWETHSTPKWHVITPSNPGWVAKDLYESQVEEAFNARQDLKDAQAVLENTRKLLESEQRLNLDMRRRFESSRTDVLHLEDLLAQTRNNFDNERELSIELQRKLDTAQSDIEKLKALSEEAAEAGSNALIHRAQHTALALQHYANYHKVDQPCGCQGCERYREESSARFTRRSLAILLAVLVYVTSMIGWYTLGWDEADARHRVFHQHDLKPPTWAFQAAEGWK